MPERRQINVRPIAEQAFGFSQAIIGKDELLIAGVASLDAQFSPLDPGDMTAQVRRVYTEIATLIHDQGFEPADLVEETIYVTDIQAFLAANSIRKGLIAPALPATTTVQVAGLVLPGLMVEVSCRVQRSSGSAR